MHHRKHYRKFPRIFIGLNVEGVTSVSGVSRVEGGSQVRYRWFGWVVSWGVSEAFQKFFRGILANIQSIRDFFRVLEDFRCVTGGPRRFQGVFSEEFQGVPEDF